MVLLRDLGMQTIEGSKRKLRIGLYECSCGKRVQRPTASIKHRLRQGTEVKCSKRCARLGNTNGATHGLRYSKLYKVRVSMMSRCYYDNDISYEHYGAKGVTVCEEWRDSPEAFIQWAEANGYKEGLHLDKDELSTRLGIEPPIYSPETCQFVTRSQNESFKIRK